MSLCKPKSRSCAERSRWYRRETCVKEIRRGHTQRSSISSGASDFLYPLQFSILAFRSRSEDFILLSRYILDTMQSRVRSRSPPLRQSPRRVLSTMPSNRWKLSENEQTAQRPKSTLASSGLHNLRTDLDTQGCALSQASGIVPSMLVSTLGTTKIFQRLCHQC